MVELLKQYKLIIVIICVLILGIGAWFYGETQGESFVLDEKCTVTTDLSSVEQVEEAVEIGEKVETQETVVNQEEVMPTMVPVYICGAVNKPGVYYILEDTLINDAIALSGGFTEEADKEYLNLASPIKANEKIVVPKKGEEIDKTLNSYENKEDALIDIESDSSSQCMNINTASVSELMNLPGIGEVKAKAILAYREEIGGFKSIEELSAVDGIGEKTLEKIKQLITIY